MLKMLYDNSIIFLSWFLGGLDKLIRGLCISIVVDLLVSLLWSCTNKNKKPHTIKNIICKKIAIFLIVGLSHTVDIYLSDFINGFRTVTILFYIVCEGVSILEGVAKFGLPIPKCLLTLLKNLKSDNLGSPDTSDSE